MKNLLWLVHGGLGEREKLGAPTFWKTVEGFIADGWKVWIIDIGTKDDTPIGARDYGDGLYIVRFNPPFLKMTDIRKIGTLFTVFQNIWTDRKLDAEAEKQIRRENLDAKNTVVYGMDIGAARAAVRVAHRHGMKVVTRFYGIWDRYALPDTFLNRVRHFPAFEAYATKADLIIMTNDGTNGDKMLKRMHNDSPSVFWRNGVDIASPDGEEPPFFDRFGKGEKLLMTLSRLHPGKRLDRAIHAFAAVAKTHPEVCLVICGYGEEKEKLEALAQEEGVGDKVVFPGMIPHEKVFDYLRHADIFLSFYDASNLGNPLYEAMRAGKAIVTLDVGDTGSVIQNGVNGILLPPDQPERIPEAICHLLDDPAEAKRLGDAAGAYARENFWTWEERIAAEVGLLNELLTTKTDNGE